MVLAGTLPCGAGAADNVQVIAHSRVAVSELPVTTLRAMFFMRIKNWPNGEPVRVFVLADRHELHKSFSKSILNIYPYVLRDTWDRMVFTGTGQAPIEVTSPEKLVQMVAETPGAIGYANTDAPKHEAIKTLDIR